MNPLHKLWCTDRHKPSGFHKAKYFHSQDWDYLYKIGWENPIGSTTVSMPNCTSIILPRWMPPKNEKSPLCVFCKILQCNFRNFVNFYLGTVSSPIWLLAYDIALLHREILDTHARNGVFGLEFPQNLPELADGPSWGLTPWEAWPTKHCIISTDFQPG